MLLPGREVADYPGGREAADWRGPTVKAEPCEDDRVLVDLDNVKAEPREDDHVLLNLDDVKTGPSRDDGHVLVDLADVRDERLRLLISRGSPPGGHHRDVADSRGLFARTLDPLDPLGTGAASTSNFLGDGVVGETRPYGLRPRYGGGRSLQDHDDEWDEDEGPSTSVAPVQALGESGWKCNYCTQKFPTTAELKEHISEQHDLAGPYKCETCGQGFAKQYNLSRHILTHRDPRPYQCDLCKKRFVYKCTLVVHIRTIHSGERRYRCDMCQKRFADKSKLAYHIRTHTGEKPFQCPVCKVRMTGKAQLVAHMRKHTGEKPYKCDYCGQRFAAAGTRLRHVNTKHF